MSLANLDHLIVGLKNIKNLSDAIVLLKECSKYINKDINKLILESTEYKVEIKFNSATSNHVNDQLYIVAEDSNQLVPVVFLMKLRNSLFESGLLNISDSDLEVLRNYEVHEVLGALLSLSTIMKKLIEKKLLADCNQIQKILDFILRLLEKTKATSGLSMFLFDDFASGISYGGVIYTNLKSINDVKGLNSDEFDDLVKVLEKIRQNIKN